jgi:hypothetical protein
VRYVLICHLDARVPGVPRSRRSFVAAPSIRSDGDGGASSGGGAAVGAQEVAMVGGRRARSGTSNV